MGLVTRAIWLSLVLAVIVGVATLMPVSSLPDAVPGSDKLHHLLAFAALAFPMIAARPANALWVLPVVAGYGGVIELIQPYFGRQAEWVDFFADAAGALSGGLAGWLAHVCFRPNRPPLAQATD
ncbi:hypothetical protein SAMN04488238_10890 [Roseicitreum antarcticum]|uniref:VanZ like family protein n=2 Tax=Roseicitreum antarcticum TaxID=564137 RepID=A0A1H3BKJ7_9RHOB|nr:hypothetical protein SAMN04488238_10890 [Roseicitreum antarcticum]